MIRGFFDSRTTVSPSQPCQKGSRRGYDARTRALGVFRYRNMGPGQRAFQGRQKNSEQIRCGT